MAEAGAEASLSLEPFRVVELAVRASGDVNRHAYADMGAARRLIGEVRPDVVDIHEEPFSVAARQWLGALGDTAPVVMYTAQNIDKRLPPPFYRYEQAAYKRVAAFYPCSRQAASVLRGKGFGGGIEVLPLGYDDALFRLGSQSVDADEIVLMLVGRLVSEKGPKDAVHALARVNAVRPARLVISGQGPEEMLVRKLATSLGVSDRVEFRGWQTVSDLALSYRSAHVVLVPSRSTRTWAEQFGRVIVEAQASGAVVAGYASGAIPEVAGDAAAIVPIGHVDQLAETVVRLISDSDDFARRREVGRGQAATRTWHAVAERQRLLYERVVAEPRLPVDLPSSPRRRRIAAHDEFGPPASTPSGFRPFALPFLRGGGVLARVLGTMIDTATESAHRLLP